MKENILPEARVNPPEVHIQTLYRQHGPALLSYLERTFGQCASPEDLLQETFVAALRSAESCLTADSPRAFLFGIARHIGLSAHRRAKVRVTRPLTNFHLPAPPAADSALADMRDAIHQLPEILRETLDLRLRAELSYEEIAAVLEIPVGTVRSRLHTAVKTLRAVLE